MKRPGRYAVLCGDFHRHPKTGALGMAARGILASAWSYCADGATDGVIPRRIMLGWAIGERAALAELLASGMVREDDVGSFHAVGFLDANRSRAEHERRSNTSRENGGLGGRPRVNTAKSAAESKAAGLPDGLRPGALEKPTRLRTQDSGHQDTEEERERATPSSEPAAPELPGLPPSKTPAEVADERVGRVFAHWQRRCAKASAKLTGGRRKKIVTRLKTYPEADLLAAIDGCAGSDWHMGRDPKTNGRAYNDLESILDSDTSLEKFRDWARVSAPSSRHGHEDDPPFEMNLHLLDMP